MSQLQPNIFSGYFGNFIPNAVATIANGGTTSTAIECKGLTLVGLFLPAAFTGTALTFLASQDGVNFFPVYDADTHTAVSYTVGQGNYYAINPEYFYGINYLEIVSGSSEGGARTLYAALKGL